MYFQVDACKFLLVGLEDDVVFLLGEVRDEQDGHYEHGELGDQEHVQEHCGEQDGQNVPKDEGDEQGRRDELDDPDGLGDGRDEQDGQEAVRMLFLA